MDYARVIVPVAPIRRKAKHQAEMTNQLLFGEPVKILKQKGPLWIKIRSLTDSYDGWMTRNMIHTISSEEALLIPDFMTVEAVSRVQMNNSSMLLPAGSLLPYLYNGAGKIGEIQFFTDSPVSMRSELKPSAERINELGAAWLNAPYLWGGKTILGIDCSGFVQIVYRLMGIDLPRDAWQQAQEGGNVKKLKEAICGDLAFFDDRDEIVHVGILLGTDKIIHASGKVRIDTIDKKGIINSDTGKRTHSLRVIKRGW